MGKAGTKLHSLLLTIAALALLPRNSLGTGCHPGDSQAPRTGGSEISRIVDTFGRSAKIHIAPRARMVQRGHEFSENDIRRGAIFLFGG